jgi:hypothetical protein
MVEEFRKQAGRSPHSPLCLTDMLCIELCRALLLASVFSISKAKRPRQYIKKRPANADSLSGKCR